MALRLDAPLFWAAVVGVGASASAFAPHTPLTGLLLLPVALERAGSWGRKLLIGICFGAAMSWQLIPVLVGYGFSAGPVVFAIAAVVILQAVVMSGLPVLLAMAVLFFSPVFWGHPIFALWGVSPVHGHAAVVFGGVVLALICVRRTQLAGLGVYAACALLTVVVSAPARSPTVIGVDTAFTSRSFLPATDWSEVAGQVERVSATGKFAIALPESTIEGDWGRGEVYFREVAQLTGHDLLVGESTPRGQVIRWVSNTDPKVVTVYRQRQPILGVDWHPWNARGEVEAAFGNGVASVDIGKGRRERLGFLICYEGYLALPWAETIIADPQAIVVIANDRWSRGSRYPVAARKIRAAAEQAAGVDVIAARNR
ncbi:MAG: hypothetical protein KGN33_07980 [Paracoccaceae bacterium]|nr:hypothetical protein [Paracoccaceae bacterium]